MRSLLRVLWDMLLKFQRIVLLSTLFFCTLAMFIEVVVRYILKTSFVGIEEMATYVAFWMYFMGASYASYERNHIKAELIHLVFGTSKKYAISRAIGSLISFAVLAFAIPWAFDYLLWGISMNEQSLATFLGKTYPVFWFQASIPVGISLMVLYSFVELVQWVKIAFTKDQVPGEMISPREEVSSWI